MDYKTYSNSCRANCAKVGILHDGPCFLGSSLDKKSLPKTENKEVEKSEESQDGDDI